MATLRKILPAAALLTISFCSLWAQEPAREHPQDSVFKLVQADVARQIEDAGFHYRIIQGNAKFFHNNTYFLCDSASWNVEAHQVFAFGNVQVIQEGTMLKSDQMTYYSADNTARFRGRLVELFDKEGNTLRTEWLDYNTKDSVAVFSGGGSMMNRDSSVIESDKGRYEAREKVFYFSEDVQVWMDSILISTDRMDYNTAQARAYFHDNTSVWKDKGYVNADSGWYDRKNKLIHFADNVYMDDPEYEAWAAEVSYDENSGEVNMYENAQVLDTARRAYYTADHILYQKDSIAGRVTLSRDPAIILCGENDSGQPDTLYVRADSLLVYSRFKCDIPEQEISDAAQRLEDIMFDALKKKRDEQAAERAKATEEALRKAGKLPPEQKAAENQKAKAPVADSLAAQRDSLQVPADSLRAPSDTLASAPDSTKIRYVLGYRQVKAFRSDLQLSCDSLVFCELDSIARLFGRPILWNEIKNQLTSETMQILIKDGNAHRGSMVTDAWIVSQVDTVYYNQIKSTEMVGYFHDNDLYRYDALGGVNALFFMMDGDLVTTANLKEAKSLSAMIRDGNARRLLYNEQISSDAYPAVDLPKEKMYLKGFEWRGKERPQSPEEITVRKPHSTQRAEYSYIVLPHFWQTSRFFIDSMKDRIPYIDSIQDDRRSREDERQARLE